MQVPKYLVLVVMMISIFYCDDISNYNWLSYVNFIVPPLLVLY